MSEEGREDGSSGDVQLGAAAEATVMAYHQLALDADKRLHLALDDTCLQFLSLVIGNGYNKLVTAALNTLSALAESQDCRAPMASTFGVLHCLKASVEEDNDHTDEMKSQSAELFTCLNFAYHQQKAARRRSKMPVQPDKDQPSASADKDKKEKDSDSKLKEPRDKSAEKTSNKHKSQDDALQKESEVTKSNKAKGDKDTDRGSLVKSDSIESNCSSVSVSSCSQPSQRAPSSPNPSGEERHRNKYYRDPKHRTRMITLLVKGMHTPAERGRVEGALVRVRGVISLVFDLAKCRVSCRVRRVLDLTKLGSAVEGLDEGMRLYQVVARTGGEEIEIPLSGHSGASPAKDVRSSSRSPAPVPSGEEDVLPDYLPEDEDDDLTGTDDPASAVATTGTVIKEAASNLFSAAASLLHQSFYW